MSVLWSVEDISRSKESGIGMGFEVVVVDSEVVHFKKKFEVVSDANLEQLFQLLETFVVVKGAIEYVGFCEFDRTLLIASHEFVELEHA